jgi:hypothetical protein
VALFFHAPVRVEPLRPAIGDDRRRAIIQSADFLEIDDAVRRQVVEAEGEGARAIHAIVELQIP